MLTVKRGFSPVVLVSIRPVLGFGNTATAEGESSHSAQWTVKIRSSIFSVSPNLGSSGRMILVVDALKLMCQDY